MRKPHSGTATACKSGHGLVVDLGLFPVSHKSHRERLFRAHHSPSTRAHATHRLKHYPTASIPDPGGLGHK